MVFEEKRIDQSSSSSSRSGSLEQKQSDQYSDPAFAAACTAKSGHSANMYTDVPAVCPPPSDSNIQLI